MLVFGDQTYTLGYLPVATAYHAVVHSGRSIYTFGGAFSVGNSLIPDVGTSNFYNISSESFDCSTGNYGKNCSYCGSGTYNAGLNMDTCQSCPPGTFANNFASSSYSQCTPCDYGFFSDKWGTTMCKHCITGNECPIGSIKSQTLPTIEAFVTVQPIQYDDQKLLASYYISISNLRLFL